MIELKSIEIDIILNLNRNHCLIELKTKYSHHRSLPKPPSLTISVKYVFFFFLPFQLKSLMISLHLLVKKNIKYQYLILASLILVACYINSVSHFSTIQLRLINKCNTDFELFHKCY
jgi:choline-glycine betaine transporter